MMRHDEMHYTPEQVRDHLEAALNIVDELGPPDDLRVIFFDKAVNLLSAKQIVMEQTQPLPALLGRPGSH